MIHAPFQLAVHISPCVFGSDRPSVQSAPSETPIDETVGGTDRPARAESAISVDFDDYASTPDDATGEIHAEGEGHWLAQLYLLLHTKGLSRRLTFAIDCLWHTNLLRGSHIWWQFVVASVCLLSSATFSRVCICCFPSHAGDAAQDAEWDGTSNAKTVT